MKFYVRPNNELYLGTPFPPIDPETLLNKPFRRTFKPTFACQIKPPIQDILNQKRGPFSRHFLHIPKILQINSIHLGILRKHSPLRFNTVQAFILSSYYVSFYPVPSSLSVLGKMLPLSLSTIPQKNDKVFLM